MAAVHTTYYFSVRGNADMVEKQCETLMQALLAKESLDPRVMDSTVSVDLGIGIVQVEAYAVADTRAEAESMIAERIESAVSSTAGLSGAIERERRIELINA